MTDRSDPKIQLTEEAHAVWRALAEDGPLEMAALTERTGLDQAQVMAVAAPAATAGRMAIDERERLEIDPADDAPELLKEGLPERRAAQRVREADGEMPVGEVVAWSKESGVAMNEIFRWGQARGWLSREKGDGGVRLVLTEAGEKALAAGEPDADEQAVALAVEGAVTYADELGSLGVDRERVETLLANRPEVARLRERTERTLSLTDAGRELFDSGVEVLREVNALTSEDLRSGAWREVTLRPYDVTLPAAEVFPAKVHPLRKIMEETRRSFLEMGFEEVVSPMVESAFWNFDALFQPQDHPARDMQDTFYMAEPGSLELPDGRIVDAVRAVHEDGGDTGSDGWGYQWSPERARQVVLRTHTTAATIRSLAENPKPPRKIFCVGWTYRNETISFKHLPVFHQVDGVVIDEEASLATLLGTLAEFYRKMGFDRVKFKPAFYPYTEPSVDVVVYMASRDQWIEMGGAGIFRPEVTEPLGCRHRVLAWGLGVERLAMLRLGLSNIRDLYEGNLDRLEEVPLCR